MSLKDRLPELLFTLFTGTLYTFSLCWAVLDPTALQIPVGVMLLWSALAVLLFHGLFLNRTASMCTLALTVVAGVSGWLYLRSPTGSAEHAERLFSAIAELVEFALDRTPYSESYDKPIGITLVLALAFVATLLIRIQFSFYPLVIFGAAVIWSLPLYGHGRLPAAVLLYVFCCIVFLVRKLSESSLAQGQGGCCSFTLKLIPVLLLVTAAAYALPRPESTERAETDFVAVQNLFDFEGLTSSVAGFNRDRTRLGGARRFSGLLVMEVTASERLYLAGKALDTYTGSAWYREDETTQELTEAIGGGFPVRANPAVYNIMFGDIGKTLDSVLTESLYSADGENSTVTIIMEPGEKTGVGEFSVKPANPQRTVFAPGGVVNLTFSEDVSLLIDSYDSLSLKRTPGEGFEYGGTYYYDNVAVTGSGSALESGASYRYLALPDSLPPRVGELAAEITKGIDGDYDKMTALQEYLLSFEYTLTPPRTPYGADFVDYFLFESQEGYCTYFATALAVMGRTLGIQTRYVEGYVTPPEKTNGVYLITDAQAHAWVEACLTPSEGSWVRFEPTPPDFETEGQAYVEALAAAATDVPSPSASPSAHPSASPSAAVSQGNEASEGIGSGEVADGGSTSMPLIALLVVLLIAAAAAFFLLLRPALFRKRLMRLPRAERVKLYFALTVKAMKRSGLALQDGETAAAFAARAVTHERVVDSGAKLESMAAVFGKAAYSLDRIDDSELELMRNGLLALSAANRRLRFFHAIDSILIISKGH